MPNWCANDLYIYGPNRDQILNLVKSDDPSDPEVFTFQKIIPRPAILDQTISGSQTEESLKARELAIRETGFPDWCEWSRVNWGTKWDACRASLSASPSRLKYTFETAWAPPEPVIRALSKMFPENRMKHCFFECGMAYQGRRVYLAGILLESKDDKYHGRRGG